MIVPARDERAAASPSGASRGNMLSDITAPELEGQGGVYCEDCDIAIVEPELLRGVRPYAIDPARAQRLWELSAHWEGVDIPGNQSRCLASPPKWRGRQPSERDACSSAIGGFAIGAAPPL